MAQKIALFNHKDGVGKTTTTFNLAWMLASKGKRVLMADTDPRCNLTGLILGYEGFEKFYENGKMDNLRDALAPAFESSPKLIEAVDCHPVEGHEGLFLLPGHLRLSEYEVTLSMAQESSGFTQKLQNMPGAIPYLLEKTAKKFDADYLLIDMAPSLSSINQNLLMASDFFAIPTHRYYSSAMAMESLAIVLPLWYTWAKKAQSSDKLRDFEGREYFKPEEPLITLHLWLFAHNGVTPGAKKLLEKHQIYWSDRSDLDALIQQAGLRRLPKFGEEEDMR